MNHTTHFDPEKDLASSPAFVDSSAAAPPIGRARALSIPLLVGVLFASLLLGILVRAPYLTLGFAEDDYDFLYQMGLARAGKLPLALVLLAPQGPHPMFAWKGLYAAQLSLFGLKPLGWHLATLLIHSIGATALFAVLLRYFASRPGALFAALLWAGAAIGNWDNPHAWIMCGMIPLATMWLLIAMAMVPEVYRNRSAWAPPGLAMVLSAALLSWGDSLAFFPLLALQLIWLERIPMGPWLPARRWLIAILVPTLLIGAIQVALVIPQLGEADRQRPFDAIEVLYRTSGELGVSLATLLYADNHPLRPDAVGVKIILAMVAAASVLLLRGAVRRIAILFFLFGGLFALLTNIGGADIDRASAVHAGHYLYLPTLSWCVLAGAFVAQGSRRWPRLTMASAAAILVPFSVHQYQVAASTRAFALETFAASTRNFEQNGAILTELARLADARGQPLRLPEFPVPLKAATSFGFWPVSSLLAVWQPEHADDIEVVPLDQIEPEDVHQVLNMLTGIRNPMVPAWMERIQHAVNYGRGFLWLDEFATHRGKPIRLPDVWITDGSFQTKIAPFLYFGFSRPAASIRVDSTTTRAEIDEVIEDLSRSMDPAAATWRLLLLEMRKDLP